MSEKHENPYRSGLYKDVFAYWKSKQVITRAELMKYTMETLGKSESAANAVVTVILSPRKESKRGDCRGNMSACGELYYAEKLARVVQNSVRQPQKFRLRWRETVLEPRKRIEKIAIVDEKTPVAEAKAETPETTEVKA